MTTMTFAPVPLRGLPRGLTVVAPAHRDDYQAALEEFRALAARYVRVDDALLAVVWGQIYRRHIQPVQQQADEARRELAAARAELEQRRQADLAAAAKRAIAAERRDPALREQVRLRDGDNCRYCAAGVDFGGRGGMPLDHVEPGVAAGADNLVVACRPCRRKKSGHLPHEVGMQLLAPPATAHIRTPEPDNREEPNSMKVGQATYDGPAGGMPPLVAAAQAHAQDADSEMRRLAVQVRVVYPQGASPQSIVVSWSCEAAEPTPDELAELIDHFRPGVTPEGVEVTWPRTGAEWDSQDEAASVDFSVEPADGTDLRAGEAIFSRRDGWPRGVGEKRWYSTLLGAPCTYADVLAYAAERGPLILVPASPLARFLGPTGRPHAV